MLGVGDSRLCQETGVRESDCDHKGGEYRPPIQSTESKLVARIEQTRCLFTNLLVDSKKPQTWRYLPPVIFE